MQQAVSTRIERIKSIMDILANYLVKRVSSGDNSQKFELNWYDGDHLKEDDKVSLIALGCTIVDDYGFNYIIFE